MDRATRRAHSQRILQHRLRDAKLFRGREDPIFKTPHKCDKNHPMGCRCHRKKHGNPKISVGVCYGYGMLRVDVLRRRALSRELLRHTRWDDLESDEAVLASLDKRW